MSRIQCISLLSPPQDMNDESIVEAVDFSEFEALFQTKRFVQKQSRMHLDGEQAHTSCLVQLYTLM